MKGIYLYQKGAPEKLFGQSIKRGNTYMNIFKVMGCRYGQMITALDSESCFPDVAVAGVPVLGKTVSLLGMAKKITD